MKIVIFVVDSLRASNLGCYGYGKKTSPNIDAIARENVLFKNAVSQSNWTYPSLYSLLSGKYASKLNLSFFDQKINESLKVLPEILAEKGFYTSLFTSFESFVNPETFGDHFNEAFHIEPDDDSIARFSNWMKAERDSFLMFHVCEYVHEPYFAEKEDILKFLDKDINPDDPELADKTIETLTSISTPTDGDTLNNINRKINLRQLRLSRKQLKYLLAAYDAGIYTMDSYVGTIYEIMKDAAEDCFFILMADHGQAFMEHGFWGHGLHLYDEMCKVPLICDFNGRFNGRFSEPVQLLDLYPTLMELLEIKSPTLSDGRSLLPLLSGEEEAERYALSESYPFISLRKEQYKLISSQLKFLGRPDALKTLSSVIKTGSGKQILFNLYAYLSADKLYQTEDDPGERENLRFKKGEVYRSLKDELRALIDKCKGETFPPVTKELTEDIKKQLENLGYM